MLATSDVYIRNGQSLNTCLGPPVLEDRIRVATFFKTSILVGERNPPPKNGKRALLGDLDVQGRQAQQTKKHGCD